jgi:hypothetical protein
MIAGITHDHAGTHDLLRAGFMLTRGARAPTRRSVFWSRRDAYGLGLLESSPLGHGTSCVR